MNDFEQLQGKTRRLLTLGSWTPNTALFELLFDSDIVVQQVLDNCNHGTQKPGLAGVMMVTEGEAAGSR